MTNTIFNQPLPTELGNELHEFASLLFPIPRSLTGDGVRATLREIQKQLPELRTYEVPTGTECLDWVIPDEWAISEAYIVTPSGKRIADFHENNLHLVGYSVPIDRLISRSELEDHLHSIPSQPDAIPYITSYYERRWGFCLTQRDRDALVDGDYQVVIKSKLEPGFLSYADLVIKGESEEEILFTTYVCHPSLANNEISGPVVATYLAKWLLSLESRRFTYRFVFAPETIGSIFYIHKHLPDFKSHLKAGFVITCIGDNRSYSYLSSRLGGTLADRVAEHILDYVDGPVHKYSYLARGSDERQYCAPGVDLPVCSLMRTKYWEYPEYHTSLDDLTVITPDGLLGGLNLLVSAVKAIESNTSYQSVFLCEPQLGNRGLLPTLSSKANAGTSDDILNILSYSDSNHDLLTIAEMIRKPVWDLREIADRLVDEDLLREVPGR